MLERVHPDWIVPDWPAPPHVKALITTRAGGVSAGPYESFNIGLSTGDDARAIEANRARLRTVLPREPRWLKQVHGARVVDGDTNGNASVDRPEADACVARERGNVCAVLVADCLPVLFTDRAGTLVGAAHAGWRGLAGGVLENTVEALAASGARPEDVLAYLGPAIGPAAFEVGDDVYTAYTQSDPQSSAAFVPHGNGKWLADLFALARRALARSGVTAVYGGGLCTHSNPARFYSYRREKNTGRMGAFIWRE
jgi:YfiH family protein